MKTGLFLINQRPGSSACGFHGMNLLDRNSWLTVELSSICNLRCPACSQPADKKQFISKQIFFKLVDELIQSNTSISSINPFFRGESLLHPDFSEMMDYLRASCVKKPIVEYLVLHTNGTFLEGENSRAILDLCDQKILLHPGNLILSIDAATKETYDLIRPGGNFRNLIENIRSFIDARKDRGQWGPDIIFQFIVQERNQNEAMKFISLISELLNENSHKPFRTACSPDNEHFRPDMDIIYLRQLETVPENREHEYRRYMKVCRDTGLIGDSSCRTGGSKL